MGRVTVFSIASCPHCQRAKALLTRRGVPFHDVSLTDYPEKRADMLQLADRLTVPQIFFNDAHVGGATDLDVLIAAADGDAAPKSFDDVMKAVLAAPDSEDLRLRIPDHAPEPAPTPSPRTHPPVVTVGGRALSYLDAVRELLAAGLDISDRAYNLTVYRRCFVGSQAVDALIRHFPAAATDRAAAVALGQALMDAGVLHHVTRTHRFEDARLFYRLAPDAAPGVLNAFRADWTDRVDNPMRTVKHLQKTFGKLQAAHTRGADGLVDYAAVAADPAYVDFKEAICEFRAVDLGAMDDTTRMAFLINLYNLMVVHAFAHVGAARTNGGRYTFFDKVLTNVGGHLYSFNDLEQGLIRGNKAAPYHMFPVFGAGDPRAAFAITSAPPDPRVHFALNCGAKSCPPIKTFTAEALDEELRLAAAAFNEDQATVRVTGSGGAHLQVSTILKWYRSDFGRTDAEVAARVCEWLRGESKAALAGVLAAGGRVKVVYAPYDWTTNGTENSPEYARGKLRASYSRITG